MKRALLKVANAFLRPLGARISRADNFDMESALRWIADQRGQVGTVIDIGASTGRWSAMAMPFFPQARFIGIDPLKEREPALLQLKSRVPRFDYVLAAACAVPETTVELAVTADLDGSTVSGEGGALRSVPAYSVDRVIEMKACNGPYVLKFDTHGFEVPILAGAALALDQTEYIVMEVYNFRHTEGTLLFYEMCALLDSKGFRCLQVVDLLRRPIDNALWQMDVVFARKDHQAFRENTYLRAS